MRIISVISYYKLFCNDTVLNVKMTIFNLEILVYQEVIRLKKPRHVQRPNYHDGD